jgi:predicted DCC family thiol-disulfide oxidoreductase YuxK
MQTNGRPVLYFDGVCSLCNRSIQFVIKQDKKQQFLFAPLQGEAGKEALKHLHPHNPDSVVLQYMGKYYTQSDAILKVLKILGGVWSLSSIVLLIPGFIRNGLYKIVARSRYKWFGKTDSCMVPKPALKARFLN